MIDAGDLVHRVTIYEPITTRDGSGQSVEGTPKKLYSLRVKIEEVAGGEGLRGRQVDATTTHILTGRYCTGITPKHYVDWKGRRLNITATTDRTGLRRELELHCKEQR